MTPKQETAWCLSVVMLTMAAVLVVVLAGCGGGGGGGDTVSGGASTVAGMSGTGTSAGAGAGTATGAGTGTGAGSGATTGPAAGTGTPSSSPAPTTPSGTYRNPFDGAALYVDPNSWAAQQVTAWQVSRPADAAQVQKIARQPQARWISGGDATVPQNNVDFLRNAPTDRTLLLCVYNIPNRDCGGLAGGGATSAANYRAWIDQFVTLLGSRAAIVILEPDATASIGCLSATALQERWDLLHYAIRRIEGQGSAVYLDAGNPYWVNAATQADRLTQAGVADAHGFAVNVANEAWVKDCLSYGDTISARLGGKHFVTDTSRNGLGPAEGNQWCNPPGRALGPQPGSPTGDPLCDAFAFVKNPGTSDGACNGGPAWGWWPDNALELCKNAAW